MIRAVNLAGGFIVASGMLCVGALAIAIGSFLDGDLERGLLMAAVSVFAGWMTTAIHQFQRRMTGIDEVVRQARQRVDHAEKVLSEMRQLSNRLRSSSSTEKREEDRTIH